MNSLIKNQACDVEYLLRGNSVSNMRNGGYVLLGEDILWYVNELEFIDGEMLYYLEKVLLSQIGSRSAQRTVIAEFASIMSAYVDGKLYYIDIAEGNTVSSYDTKTGERTLIFDKGANSLQMIDGILYWSTITSGDIWSYSLGGYASPSLLISQGGTLIGISGGNVFVRQYNGSDNIFMYDLVTKKMRGQVSGGNYEQAHISGEYIFFLDEGRLKRQHIQTQEISYALSFAVSEFVICSDYLLVAAPQGGMYLSFLDGSNAVKITEDIGSSLQLVGNLFFYRNGYDNDRVYVIDLLDGKRQALFGETLTDGGIQFEQLSTSFVASLPSLVIEQSISSRDLISRSEQFGGSLVSHSLFIEYPLHEDSPLYYRRIGQLSNPEDVGSLVVITYDLYPLGQYTDGGIAYRLDTLLTLFKVGVESPYVTWRLEGYPPVTIKHGPGDRIGLPMSWHQQGLEMLRLVQLLSPR